MNPVVLIVPVSFRVPETLNRGVSPLAISHFAPIHSSAPMPNGVNDIISLAPERIR